MAEVARNECCIGRRVEESKLDVTVVCVVLCMILDVAMSSWSLADREGNGREPGGPNRIRSMKVWRASLEGTGNDRYKYGTAVK